MVEVDWEGLGAPDDTTTDHGLITASGSGRIDGSIDRSITIKGLREGLGAHGRDDRSIDRSIDHN